MPANLTPEYYKAESKFRDAKNPEDKIIALEEMIRLAPKHKGTEHLLANLKSKLSKMKKDRVAKKKSGGRSYGVQKEGEAQICLIGFTNSGKSTLLKKLTDANPKIANYEYTTKKPVVGMMNYKKVNIQLVEIPATMKPVWLSIARSSDGLVFVIREKDDEKKLKKMKKDKYIHKDFVTAKATEDPENVKKRVWNMLGFMLVHTKETPMALVKGSTVRHFAKKIHKDFLKQFKFARVQRNGRVMQVGLNYKLKDEDVVEIFTD